MNVDAEGANFNVLVDFLKAELQRGEADRKAILLASESSFREWAFAAIGAVAQGLGITIGFLAGVISAAYETVKGSFESGFRRGIDRGRRR